MRSTFGLGYTSFLILAAFVGSGCGGTRYDVVGPAEFRGPLAENAGVPKVRDGIEYELFSGGGQAMIVFINRTGSPLRLTSDSTVLDATGRSFLIDEQFVPVNQSGRVVLPPAIAAERSEALRPPPTDINPRVGGIDEGGLITRAELSGRRDAEPTRGFRWMDGQTARARLVFEPESGATTTTTAPAARTRVQHEFTLRRSR